MKFFGYFTTPRKNELEKEKEEEDNQDDDDDDDDDDIIFQSRSFSSNKRRRKNGRGEDDLLHAQEGPRTRRTSNSGALTRAVAFKLKNTIDLAADSDTDEEKGVEPCQDHISILNENRNEQKLLSMERNDEHTNPSAQEKDDHHHRRRQSVSFPYEYEGAAHVANDEERALTTSSISSSSSIVCTGRNDINPRRYSLPQTVQVSLSSSPQRTSRRIVEKKGKEQRQLQLQAIERGGGSNRLSSWTPHPLAWRQENTNSLRAERNHKNDHEIVLGSDDSDDEEKEEAVGAAAEDKEKKLKHIRLMELKSNGNEKARPARVENERCIIKVNTTRREIDGEEDNDDENGLSLVHFAAYMHHLKCSMVRLKCISRLSS
jgi:hypothetical protein